MLNAMRVLFVVLTFAPLSACAVASVPTRQAGSPGSPPEANAVGTRTRLDPSHAGPTAVQSGYSASTPQARESTLAASTPVSPRQHEECAQSRTERFMSVREQAVTYVARKKRLEVDAPTVRAMCTQHDSSATVVLKGSRTRVQHIGQTQDVSCAGSLPKGVTHDDARFLVYDEPELPFEITPADRVCRAADRGAGLELVVKRGDVTATAHLVAWRPANRAVPTRASTAVAASEAARTVHPVKTAGSNAPNSSSRQATKPKTRKGPRARKGTPL